jgi:hypothetical protein
MAPLIKRKAKLAVAGVTPGFQAREALHQAWQRGRVPCAVRHSIRINRPLKTMWIFRLLQLLVPKHAADMIQKVACGVVLLERSQ